MKNTKKLFVLYIILMLFSLSQLIAQKIELDINYGYHEARASLYHPTVLIQKNDTEFGSFRPSINTYLGITNELAKNFYLRIELGHMKTNIDMTPDFDRPDGRVGGWSYLTNQKLYLGFLPEFRFKFKVIPEPITFKIHAGALMSSDISNIDFDEPFEQYHNSSNPLGFKIGGSMQVMIDKVGFQATAFYTRFGPSEILNDAWPSIGFDIIGGSVGIVYTLN